MSFVYHPRANQIATRIRGRQDGGTHYRYDKAVNNQHDQFDAIDVMSLNHRVDRYYSGDYSKYFNTLTASPKSREGQLLMYIAGNSW